MTFINIFNLLSPFIAVFLVYWLGIKRKLKDTDFEKKHIINSILSNLLIVWQYFIRLEKLRLIKISDKLPLPKDYLVLIFLKSGVLDDKIFTELDNSILEMKKYDPINFQELNGLGKKISFINSNFILPFLKSKSHTEINTILIKNLHDMISDLEGYLNKLFISIGDKKGFIKIKNANTWDIEEITKEFIKEYYNLLILLVPATTISLEQFENIIQQPETQQYINSFSTFLINIEIDKLVEVLSANPSISYEELIEQVKLDVEKYQQMVKN